MFWVIAAALAAQSTPATEPKPAPRISPLPTVQVQAIGETQAVASARDAADDPAIWRNPRRSARSLIVATDKQSGLNVYDLDGKLLSTLPVGRVNNVDLRTLMVRGRPHIIVTASDRNDKADGKLAMFELDTDRGMLRDLGRARAAPGEAYGLCMYQPRRNALYAFIVMKDGTISQMRIDWTPDGPAEIEANVVRTMKLATQSEGCVADDRTGTLFVAEEDVGIWRFGADPGDAVEGKLVAPVDDARLFADVEGLAIAAKGSRGGWLVASSQGDSSYTAFRLPDMGYAGRFKIAAGAFGATSDTDGIEINTARFGGGRNGMMIAQDGDNAPSAQNFKIIRWSDVVKALKLR